MVATVKLSKRLLQLKHRIFDKSNMIDATGGTGIAYHSGSPEFIPGFFLGFVLLDLWASIGILSNGISTASESICCLWNQYKYSKQPDKKGTVASIMLLLSKIR
jgi:hypothetical protein